MPTWFLDGVIFLSLVFVSLIHIFNEICVYKYVCVRVCACAGDRGTPVTELILSSWENKIELNIHTQGHFKIFLGPRHF